jgi:hypothetical protein
MSATGALFCMASITLRVCSYVPYDTPAEALVGDDTVAVDGTDDMMHEFCRAYKRLTRSKGKSVEEEQKKRVGKCAENTGLVRKRGEEVKEGKGRIERVIWEIGWRFACGKRCALAGREGRW